MKHTKKNKPTFLFDEAGKKTGVLLKIANFEEMMEELEDYADYKMIKQRAKKKYKTYTKEEVMAETFKRKGRFGCKNDGRFYTAKV